MKTFKTSIVTVKSFTFILLTGIIAINGCTPTWHAKRADKIAYSTLDSARKLSLSGPNADDDQSDAPFTIEYRHVSPKCQPGETYKLSLAECVRLSLNNNLDYQNKKEELYIEALDYAAAEHYWGGFSGDSAFAAGLTGQDNDNGPDVVRNGSGGLGYKLTRKLAHGGIFTLGLVLNMTTDLMDIDSTTFGSGLQASFTQPLLRGAWSGLARESLFRQRRDLLISVFEFERYTQTFCTEIIADYFGVLQDLDKYNNEIENIKRLQLALRRIGIQVEAGQAKRIEFDRAEQDLFSARKRLLNLKSTYINNLDKLIRTMSLSVNLDIELDNDVLANLSENDMPPIPFIDTAVINEETEKQLIEVISKLDNNLTDQSEFSQQLRQELINRKREDIFDELFFAAADKAVEKTVNIALHTRPEVLDAMVRLRDSRKDIDIAANAFLPQLDLVTGIGVTGSGDRRIERIDFGKNTRVAGLSLDYDFDQTENRNNYRKAIIDYAHDQRNLLVTVGNTCQDIRKQYRTLIEKKRTYQLQTQSLKLAQRRQQLTALEQAEGRADAEEVLDAEEALRDAQNDLTSAAVDYNNTLLEFLASQGLLKIESSGKYSTREVPQLFDKIEKHYGSLDEAIKEASKAHFKD